MAQKPDNGTYEAFLAGPNPVSRQDRAALCGLVVDRLVKRHGKRIRTILISGSVARGIDHGFSDLDLTCVLQDRGVDGYEEWAHRDSKIEIALLGEDVILKEASDVTGSWPFSPGAYLSAKVLYGDEGFLEKLQQTIRSAPKEDFDRAIRVLMIDGLYGGLSKLRGAGEARNIHAFPQLTVEFLEDAAFVIALARRHCFAARVTVLEETLQQPGLPDAFGALCALVMSGRLDNPSQTRAACEDLWRNIVPMGTDGRRRS